MKKILMMGAALAFVTGSAFAQSVTETTTRTVTPSGQEQLDVSSQQKSTDGSTITKSYSRSNTDAGAKVDRSETVTDAAGNQTEKSRSVTRDAVGTHVKSKTKTTTADGTEETVRTEHRVDQ